MVQNPMETEDFREDVEEERDVESDIKECMANGKRHFLCNDYNDAIACFQEACSLLSEKYGQTSPECSEAYYYYGVSLLEMARMENGVLGNALKGVPDGEDSDKEVEQFEKPTLKEKERQELRETVEAAMATEEEEDSTSSDEDKNIQKEGSADKDDESIKKEGSADKEDQSIKKEGSADKEDTSIQKEDSKDQEVKSIQKEDSKDQKPEETAKESKEDDPDIKNVTEVTEQTRKDKSSEETKLPKTDESSDTKDLLIESEQPCTSTADKADQAEEEEEEPEDPDDIPNMQLAWEMLELAKHIYLKKEYSKDNSLMVAQCHLKLGELGLELENYSQAIDDFLDCLLLQKEVLSNMDRKVAESHYNLGLTYTFTKQYDKAIDQYKASLRVLENRVKHLEEVIDNKDDDDATDESMTECKEVGEIKELIPDIYSKIEDVIVLRGKNPSMRRFSPSVKSGETTIGFGSAGQSSSSSCSVISVKKSSSSTTSKESTCDITHLVRRKRSSPDDASEDGSGDCKKVKQESDGKTNVDSTDPDEEMVQDTASSETVGKGNVAQSALEPPAEIPTCAK